MRRVGTLLLSCAALAAAGLVGPALAQVGRLKTQVVTCGTARWVYRITPSAAESGVTIHTPDVWDSTAA